MWAGLHPPRDISPGPNKQDSLTFKERSTPRRHVIFFLSITHVFWPLPFIFYFLGVQNPINHWRPTRQSWTVANLLMMVDSLVPVGTNKFSMLASLVSWVSFLYVSCLQFSSVQFNLIYFQLRLGPWPLRCPSPTRLPMCKAIPGTLFKTTRVGP